MTSPILRGMGRHKRPHAPGMIFHLVSRTHRAEPLYVPELRDEIAHLIQRIGVRTDGELLAYAIMPSHLHILLRQGPAPLSDTMQPLLRRVAHRLQRHHDFRGTVVERRYRDSLCASVDHARESLLYVHLNPWRAGLCDDGLGYPWTTHAAYLPGSDPGTLGIDRHAQKRVLSLFARADGRTRDQLCADYIAALDWRMDRDRVRAGDDTVPPRPAPRLIAGDRAWQRDLARIIHGSPSNGPSEARDLRDFVLDEIVRIAPECTLADLLGSWIPRRLVKVRRRLIRAAAARRYRTADLARLFAVSPAAVSQAKHGEN